jgi:multisubunit Na+/H+ antiporter MnhE subunit
MHCAQVRSVVLGAVFGAVFSIIVHKLNLTSGVIPSMGMAIALINFFSVNSWNAALRALRIATLPFTPQARPPRATLPLVPCMRYHAQLLS